MERKETWRKQMSREPSRAGNWGREGAAEPGEMFSMPPIRPEYLKCQQVHRTVKRVDVMDVTAHMSFHAGESEFVSFDFA